MLHQRPQPAPGIWPQVRLTAIAGCTLLSTLAIGIGDWSKTAIAQSQPPQTTNIITSTRGFLQTPRDRNATALGSSITQSYTDYCQPEYPPTEKPICLLGLGDKLPEGDELAGDTEPSEPQNPAVTEPLPLVAPVPYQYDKTQLFPRL